MTSYLLLRKEIPAANTAGPPRGWDQIGEFRAASADAAIKAAAEKSGKGWYVAVPARSWKPRKVSTVQQACCVACGIAEPLELHHCVPRSQGGGDVLENLVPLCTRHHGILESHAPGWKQVAGHVRAFVMARESRLSYVLGKIGRTRFNKRYPQPPWLAVGDLDRFRQPDPWLREGGIDG